MKLYSLQLPYVDSANLFDKVAEQDWAIFLDSGVINHQQSMKKNADFDVLAIKPECTMVFDNGATFYYCQKQNKQQKLYGDPISLLQTVLPKIDTDTADLASREYAYVPGALGYFSYDLVRQYEELPTYALNNDKLPEMALGIYHVVVVIDHKAKQTYLLSLGDSELTAALVSFWVNLINSEAEISDTYQNIDFGDRHIVDAGFDENLDIDEYAAYFRQVRNYINDGDCYQVNLAKRFSAQTQGDAWATYRHLRSLSPAPYGAYMNLPFAQILSNSPESFIQCIDRHVVTSPIKGTRARDHSDPERDREIAQELFHSEKDRAENLMIVDLMRNDLSRCCELYSVKVPKLFALHSFANVHHLISTVTGTLKEGLHSLDLLKSCFPGGSITGAPKIRAMEIIEELEPNRRGLYCGSIGYIGANGDLQTNIAIRTIVIKDGVAHYSAGGGLVVDSDLDEEYQEIIDKAQMLNEALSP